MMFNLDWDAIEPEDDRYDSKRPDNTSKTPSRAAKAPSRKVNTTPGRLF